MAQWLQLLIGLDDSSMEVATKNMGSKTTDNFITESYDIHHHHLGPGPSLNKLVNTFFWELAKVFNEEYDNHTPMTAYAFVQHVLTKVNTVAMFGLRSPFALDLQLEQCFWSVPFP